MNPGEIDRDGFAVVEDVLDASDVCDLLAAVASAQDEADSTAGGIRNLLDLIPQVMELARRSAILSLVHPVLGKSAHAVRATLFDKTPDANWKVPWHQDLSIAVRSRMDVKGFGPWSVKAGVVHVQPPAAVLDKMLAVRVHLDDCGQENGALRVIPGSHRFGRLTADQIQTRSAAAFASCPVRRGGVLLMRPLLLHASSAAISPSHRRVIHIDFAGCELPGGLEWASSASRSNLSRPVCTL